jgi:hypothetical protein
LVINLVERQHRKRRITKREGYKVNKSERGNARKKERGGENKKGRKKMLKKREMLMAIIITSMEPKP